MGGCIAKKKESNKNIQQNERSNKKNSKDET